MLSEVTSQVLQSQKQSASSYQKVQRKIYLNALRLSPHSAPQSQRMEVPPAMLTINLPTVLLQPSWWPPPTVAREVTVTLQTSLSSDSDFTEEKVLHFVCDKINLLSQ